MAICGEVDIYKFLLKRIEEELGKRLLEIWREFVDDMNTMLKGEEAVFLILSRPCIFHKSKTGKKRMVMQGPCP